MAGWRSMSPIAEKSAGLAGDRPLSGIILMVAFCMLAPISDGLAKLLGGSLAIATLLLFRYGIQILALLPIIWASGIPLRASPRLLRLAAIRTFFQITSLAAMFLSLRFLPLADALAIAFVMPFILLLLGKTFLGEQVGWRRLAACCVGFSGTLLVIQPSFEKVGLPALLPLLVAVLFSIFVLVTRRIAKEADPLALQLQSGVIAMGMLLPAMAAGHFLGLSDLALSPVEPWQALLLLVMGSVGTLSHLVMTWSLRLAPATTLAPVQFLEIPFATVVGWLMFRDLPNGLAAIGILTVLGSGLYVAVRSKNL